MVRDRTLRVVIEDLRREESDRAVLDELMPVLIALARYRDTGEKPVWTLDWSDIQLSIWACLR